MRTCLFILALSLASVANASPPVVCNQRVIRQQVLAVPTIAQSVQVLHTAVPNAIYGYNAAAAQYRSNTQSIEEAENTVLLRQILAALQSQGGAVQTQAADPLSLVRKACNRCHSGEKAKAGFHTDGEMSNEDRMLAIEMILHDDPAKRMPKGLPLDPNTMGKVIQQLSRRTAQAESDEPPPPPSPDDDPVRTQGY